MSFVEGIGGQFGWQHSRHANASYAFVSGVDKGLLVFTYLVIGHVLLSYVHGLLHKSWQISELLRGDGDLTSNLGNLLLQVAVLLPDS